VNEDPIASESTDDIERRLASYAAARLELPPEAAARMRVAIVAAARARRGDRPGLIRLARRRRWTAALLLAAALTATLGGAALGASPGSPLYGLRLWVENATLPAEANARADAQLELLDERLKEAQAASVAGNGNAVAAALAAYRAEIEALLATADGDDLRLAKLEAALGTHLVVLEVLSTRVPEQARDAIANAIDKSSKAVDRVHETQRQGPNTSPGPDNSPKPDKTPNPDHSPQGPPSDHPGGG
jgi:hypothetical protein